MTTELVSSEVFRGFLSVMTAGVAGLWGTIDVIRFIRLRDADSRDPIVRDKRFGYVIGALVGVIGVVGTLRFNGVM
ncbi:MAG: hypothetical protein SFX73_19855 [Kofleriaceae bacterium]|nr:hypothetical protein [Kofleriaceae bacterium]